MHVISKEKERAEQRPSLRAGYRYSRDSQNSARKLARVEALCYTVLLSIKYEPSRRIIDSSHHMS